MSLRGCPRLGGGRNAQMCNDCGDVVARSTLLPLLVARRQQLSDTLQHGTQRARAAEEASDEQADAIQRQA